jgi:hypothetical protein
VNLPINKLPIDQLFLLIDFLGVFVGALGGALAAVRDTRYKYDLVGVTGLALACAARIDRGIGSRVAGKGLL